MSSNPKISFVMPVYNCVAWIGESLQSLLTQTILKDIEIIVVDDGSTDGTKEFLEDWAIQFPEVKVIYNEKNMGAGKSRNIGMEAAKAPIIGICDGDDINVDKRAELIIKHFDLNPKSEMVNFPNRAIGYYNENIEDFSGEPFDHDLYLKEGKITYFSNPTVAVRKESLMEIGGYGSETFTQEDHRTDDSLMVEKWVKAGKKIDFQPGYIVVFHRNLPNSMMTKIRGWQPGWVTKDA